MTIRDRALIATLAAALVVFSALSLAPALSPAGPGSSPGASIPGLRSYVEGIVGQATNVSPFGARSVADRELVSLLFRGLVRLGPNDTVVGGLASTWEVDPSGATWTFHLRPGMRWQDGEPITSDDVVFTITTLSDPSYDGPGAGSWSEVRARAVDPLTVTLSLATPLGGFLQAATQPIAPAHLLRDLPVADLSTDSFGRHPIGSGPFRLATLDALHAVLQAADPNPGGVVTDPPAGASAGAASADVFPRPYLAGMEFRFFSSVTTLRAAWDAGALDGVSGLDPGDAVAVAATPGANVVRYPASTALVVVFNLRADNTTFSDPRVRKALLEAIDRNALLRGPLLGLGSVARSLIPTWAPEFDPAASPLVRYNPDAAQADLRAAGWTETTAGWRPTGAAESLAFSLVSTDAASNPVAFAVADAVAANWRAIGLTVTHEALTPDELLSSRIAPGDFQAAVLPLVIGLDPDLYPLLASTQTKTGGANVSGLQDPTLDQLLEAARAPGTEASRLAAYADLQARLSSQLYVLPLAFRDDLVIFKSTVVGPSPRPVAGPGDRFWDVLTWRLADAQPSG